jgi:hypothetical protein
MSDTVPSGSLDEPIIFMHAERDAGAAFDNQSDVIPKIIPIEPDEWVA